jgi:hypothetical protein
MAKNEFVGLNIILNPIIPLKNQNYPIIDGLYGFILFILIII